MSTESSRDRDPADSYEHSRRRSREYYDEFSCSYEAHRHHGYHKLIDDLEIEVTNRYLGQRLLEAGCGTGLILRRLDARTERSVGADLSAGMLSVARSRGLDVVQCTVGELPFPNGCFDTVISFKVLAHVPDIRGALRELVRVTRPGGHLLLEFYNRHSLRGWIKRLKPPTRIGQQFHDEDVFTRLDSYQTICSYLPDGVRIVDLRGVRVLTPFAQLHDVPLLGPMLGSVERVAADAPVLRRLAGFLVVVLRKQ